MDGDDVARALEQIRDEIRRNGEEVRALSRGIAGGAPPGPMPAPLGEQLVTLDQIAARMRVSKRSMEKHVKRMPPPVMKGKRGRASRWRWCDVRPWLEGEFGCTLDARFPVW